MASFVGSNAVVKDGSSAVDSKELDSNDESLFGLDPLFWTHVPLFVRDVLSLRRCGRAQVFAWSPGCLSVNDPMNGPVNDSRFLRLCQVSGIVVGREDLTKCMRFLCEFFLSSGASHAFIILQ